MKVNSSKLLRRGIALFIAFSVSISGLMLEPATSNAAEVSSVKTNLYGSNGVLDSATAIEAGTEVQGSITTTSNSGVYKINLPTTGKLSISLTSYIDSKTSFLVYNAAGVALKSDANILWDTNIRQLNKEYNMYLTKGIYYIVITGHSTDSDSYGNYKFTSLFTSTNVTNSDTNNDFSMPDLITLSKTYNGQISINDRDDFYKITILADGYYHFNQVTRLNSSFSILYDEAGNEKFYEEAYYNEFTKTGKSNSIRYLKKGTYIIRIYSATEIGESTYSLNVSGCISKIKLNKTTVTLKKKKTYSLKATITPTILGSKNVIWTSSKPAVATVSSKGKITAKKKGITYITCKAKDIKGVSKKMKVIVK